MLSEAAKWGGLGSISNSSISHTATYLHHLLPTFTYFTFTFNPTLEALSSLSISLDRHQSILSKAIEQAVNLAKRGTALQEEYQTRSARTPQRWSSRSSSLCAQPQMILPGNLRCKPDPSCPVSREIALRTASQGFG